VKRRNAPVVNTDELFALIVDTRPNPDSPGNLIAKVFCPTCEKTHTPGIRAEDPIAKTHLNILHKVCKGLAVPTGSGA
jgi:hypothetical protein